MVFYQSLQCLADTKGFGSQDQIVNGQRRIPNMRENMWDDGADKEVVAGYFTKGVF